MSDLEDGLAEDRTPDNQLEKVELVFKSDTNDDGELDVKLTGTENGENGRLPTVAMTKMTKFGIYKNLIVYSLSFVLLFSSLMSFSNIQSTVNIEDGLGTTGLAVLYGVMVFTSLFVTLVTLPLLSYKMMTLCAMGTYICYVASGFYSSWYTVVPGSVIVGFGASHLWPTQQAYITQLARIHAFNTQADENDTFNLFFGIFFGLFYTCQIWGNLCSSIVFGQTQTDGTNSTNVSSSTDFCGANFCAMDAQSDNVIQQPTKTMVYIFTGFCVGVSILAVFLILIFLTNLESSTKKSEKTRRKDVLAKVSGVVRLLLTSRDQHLLIPLTVVGGITMAFITGDFNVAFVSCPYGVGSIGFVMITYGVISSMFSFIVGKVSKTTGTLLLFFIGLGCQIAVCVTMLLWRPESDKAYVTYILAAFWGIGDAVNQPLTMALYSAYFTKNLDSALSSLRVLNSLGWAVSFGYSNWICTSAKVYIVIVFLALSLICLVILHLRHKK